MLKNISLILLILLYSIYFTHLFVSFTKNTVIQKCKYAKIIDVLVFILIFYLSAILLSDNFEHKKHNRSYEPYKESEFYTERGCCSHNGGVCDCTNDGISECCNGTISNCRCSYR